MKRFILIAVAVVTFFTAGMLLAQNTLQATVPFDFYIGSKAMPAGTYRIAPCPRHGSGHILQVQHCSEGIAAMHLTFPSGTKPETTGKLIFHRYGDEYYLSEVKGLPVSGNLMLPVSEREKSLQEEQATVRTYETVEIPKPLPPQ